MRGWYFTLIFVLIYLGSHAQFGHWNAPEFKELKNKTTLIVMTGEEGLDNILMEKIETYWTLNDYKFISEKEITEYLGNKNFLFLTIALYTYTRESPKMEYEIMKFFLNYDLNSTKKGEINYDRQRILANSQFDLIESEDPLAMIQSEVKKCIQLIMNHCALAESGVLTSKMYIKDILQLVPERNREEIKNKTLWIATNQLKKGVDTAEEIRAMYKHKFEILPQYEIYRKISDGLESGVYFMFYRASNYTYKLAIDAQSSEVLFGIVATGFKQDVIGKKMFVDLSE